MLFLANNLSRMIDNTPSPIGTRIVEVHNGSSLFTGDAGSGSSNLRQYIIENDLLEAIVAMPENDFYNAGIGTYIWIMTNRKEERRKGKVQLIDATQIKKPLRKNLGLKNCETDEENRREILKLLMDFEETEKSRIFPNREFGYYSVPVYRPLRMIYDHSEAIDLSDMKNNSDLQLLENILEVWKNSGRARPLSDRDFFQMLEDRKVKIPAAKIRIIRQNLGKKDENAEICHVKPTKPDSPVEIDPDLKDKEQVPLLYPGGIDAFMQNEVLPYAPDAFYNKDEVITGYELSFTKYFYKPVELRSIAEISTDIKDIEARLKGAIDDILNV